MIETIPSHVAILVPSARKAADYLSKFGFGIGPEEKFEGEGTCEIYVEYGKGNSLLLMEPLKAGPYRRAIEKRGPGLHHLAINVLQVEEFIESLAGSGWLLHPKSLKMIQQSKTAYLARPGFPGLIEVQQKEKLIRNPNFVTEVSVPFDSKLVGLVQSIGLQSIVKPSNGESRLVVGGQTIELRSLF